VMWLCDGGNGDDRGLDDRGRTSHLAVGAGTDEAHGAEKDRVEAGCDGEAEGRGPGRRGVVDAGEVTEGGPFYGGIEGRGVERQLREQGLGGQGRVDGRRGVPVVEPEHAAVELGTGGAGGGGGGLGAECHAGLGDVAV